MAISESPLPCRAYSALFRCSFCGAKGEIQRPYRDSRGAELLGISGFHCDRNPASQIICKTDLVLVCTRILLINQKKTSSCPTCKGIATRFSLEIHKIVCRQGVHCNLKSMRFQRFTRKASQRDFRRGFPRPARPPDGSDPSQDQNWWHFVQW